VHFDGLYGSTSGGLVHRVSATQWTIDLPPGSVGALDRTVKGSTSYVASYLMPFKVTVTCMDDAACPF
jgi:hypothetical protein